MYARMVFDLELQVRHVGTANIVISSSTHLQVSPGIFFFLFLFYYYYYS